MHDDCGECFDQQPEIFYPRLLQKPLSPDSEAQDQSLLDQNKSRFQELRRLSVGKDAPGGHNFEEQLTIYSQSVLSDHKIQSLHAMQVYADAPGQEELAEGSAAPASGTP